MSIATFSSLLLKYKVAQEVEIMPSKEIKSIHVSELAKWLFPLTLSTKENFAKKKTYIYNFRLPLLL